MRPIKQIELNCDFQGYEEVSQSLVQFYFSGTLDFKKFGYGDEYQYEYVTGEAHEHGYHNEMMGFEALLVDGWDNGDGEGV